MKGSKGISIFEPLERRTLASRVPLAPMTMPPPAPVDELAQTPTILQNVKVYAWDQPKEALSFNASIRTHMERDPVEEALRVGPLLAARQPGDRAITLWQAFADTFSKMDFGHPASFVASGLDISHDLQWTQTFFSTLMQMNVPLDRVASDIESNFSTWRLLPGISDESVAVMQGIYDDPNAYANLPSEVRAFSPQDYKYFLSPTGRAAYNAWNAWQTTVINTAIKTAIFDPIRQIYGNDVAVGNYGDIAPHELVTDKNGWPTSYPGGEITGNVSAPEVYLWNGVKFEYLHKDWRWNRLIDALNTVRTSLNMPGTTVTPWVSFPSYRGDGVPQAKSTWLWEQLIRHLSAAGVSSFNYFNPSDFTSTADDAFADRLFKSLVPSQPDGQTLDPFPYDADSITTGGMTTTYSDFLKFVDQPGATSLPPITVLVNVPKPPAEKVKVEVSAATLVLTGTSHGDTIDVSQSGSRVVVVANGERIGSFAKIKKISIDAGSGSDLITVNFSTLQIASTIFGGRGDDTIRSSIGADSINGNAGNDNISGGNGNDTIYGSDGQDAINGGAGDDLLYGDAGQDSLIGSNGADTLYGGIGFDVLSGGKGTDLRITQDKDLWDTIELSKLAFTFLAERKVK